MSIRKFNHIAPRCILKSVLKSHTNCILLYRISSNLESILGYKLSNMVSICEIKINTSEELLVYLKSRNRSLALENRLNVAIIKEKLEIFLGRKIATRVIS